MAVFGGTSPHASRSAGGGWLRRTCGNWEPLGRQTQQGPNLPHMFLLGGLSLVRSVLATPTGLEPATSAVTGRRANQLRHGALLRTQL